MRRCRAANRLKLLTLAGALAVAFGANAQTVTVSPSVTSRLTYTDNVGASGSGDSDLVGEVSPAISISRRSGRVSGSFATQLRSLAHASESDRNTTFFSVQGRGQVEAIEKLLFVDMSASVSRNARSDLTGRASGDFLNIDESNETRLFSIGPRLQFRLGAETEGSVGYTSRWFSGGGDIERRRTDEWRGFLASPLAFGRFGWGLDYNRIDTTRSGASNEFSQETARATLFFQATPQFRLRGIFGYESNDYEVSSGESGRIVGGGFDWNPSPRTTLSATTEDRIFGRGYDVAFSHRRARTAWNLSYSRDISSSQQLIEESVFADPNFQRAYDLFAGEPDPVRREQLARAFLAFLGIPVSEREAFITNSYFISRTLRAGVSLTGPRNVLSFTLQRSEREQLGTLVVLGAEDDFANFDTVRTDSASLSLGHSLTPITSMNASILRSRSKGSGPTSGETRRTSLSVGLTTSFGPDATGGLSYRHQIAEGLSDFTENVVTANLGVRF